MSDQHDEIEFDEPTYSECDCCGSLTTHLTRFVYRDDKAFGVYYVAFSDAPDHDWVSILVGLGDWAEDAPPEYRVAFACRLWTDDHDYLVRLVDPEECFWRTDLLGRILLRDEALAHPWVQEVFDLTDHMVICDHPVIDFLNRPRAAASAD